MRSLLILLLALAAAKMGYREYAYRSAAEDLIIETFIAEAIAACNDRATTDETGIAYEAWQPPAEIDLLLGKADLDVYPWQTTHPLWQARYKNAYLMIKPDPKARVIPGADEPGQPSAQSPAVSRVTPSIDDSVVNRAALQRANYRAEADASTGEGSIDPQSISASEQLLAAFGQRKRKGLVCEYDVAHRTASLLHF